VATKTPKKRVALIQGGLGAEREVSLSTGKAFAKALDELGYPYETILADEKLPKILAEKKPDVALLALHGKYGEDGTVQGICEYLRIPYNGSGVLTSSLCMDKIFTKQIFLQNQIPTPETQFVDLHEEKITTPKLDFPVVVKPAREGSSIGISLVYKPENFLAAIELAAKYDHMLLIERLIEGREVTVPVFDGRSLTPIEIEPKVEFYNYENKYTAGRTEYHLPARLPQPILENCQSIALKISRIFGVRT
jgi:D-alanine-D-alanine ligase